MQCRLLTTKKEVDSALVKAENASEDDFADYIKNITSVKVNGKEYAATGKRKINSDQRRRYA